MRALAHPRVINEVRVVQKTKHTIPRAYTYAMSPLKVLFGINCIQCPNGIDKAVLTRRRRWIVRFMVVTAKINLFSLADAADEMPAKASCRIGDKFTEC